VILNVFRLEAGLLGDLCKYLWADFFAVVKSPSVFVWKVGMFKLLVGSALADAGLFLPPNPQKRTEDSSCVRKRKFAYETCILSRRSEVERQKTKPQSSGSESNLPHGRLLALDTVREYAQSQCFHL